MIHIPPQCRTKVTNFFRPGCTNQSGRRHCAQAVRGRRRAAISGKENIFDLQVLVFPIQFIGIHRYHPCFMHHVKLHDFFRRK